MSNNHEATVLTSKLNWNADSTRVFFSKKSKIAHLNQIMIGSLTFSNKESFLGDLLDLQD